MARFVPEPTPLWIDPTEPRRVLIGNDGGLAVSYDMAKTWNFLPNLPVGLFYHVSYDFATPYNVCGGMQDNYNWCGPSASRFGRGINNYDWFQILGGDGFVAIPDLRDSRIVYTESQDGNLIRRNVVTGELLEVTKHPRADRLSLTKVRVRDEPPRELRRAGLQRPHVLAPMLDRLFPKQRAVEGIARPQPLLVVADDDVPHHPHAVAVPGLRPVQSTRW